MKTRASRFARNLPFALATLATLLPVSAFGAAARRSDDALSLVPPDAASVAVVRVNELRSSPLASRLFSDADHMTVDGEAARFLSEAHLRLREDVDTVVVAGLPPSAAGGATGLALFEGRFDPAGLSVAVQARGAVHKKAAAGDYFLLSESESARRGGPSAIAFVSSHLIVAGSEPAIAGALASREAGGTAFSSGSGLGRYLNRVDPGSSVWALVDVMRYPAVQRDLQRKSEHGGASEQSAALLSAMKSVSLFAFEASAHADSLDMSATGLSADEDTRALLEDSLRGVLAMWRLAVQEKSPELVSVLRQFKVRRDGEGVTVSGTLPGNVLRTLSEKKRAENR